MKFLNQMKSIEESFIYTYEHVINKIKEDIEKVNIL